MLGAVGAGLRELVFPAACVGCGRAGALLCLVCAPRLPPFEALRIDGVSVTAALHYADGVRAALLAYKEKDRRDLAPVFGDLLRRACPDDRGVLVPVPSTRQAVRRRGGDHVRRLAAVATRGTGRWLPALRLRRAVHDSAGLSVAARRTNLAMAFVAAPPPSPGTCAVVVDDIVTTGATTAEAARALRAAGWQVAAAAVVAATPRPTGRTLAGPR